MHMLLVKFRKNPDEGIVIDNVLVVENLPDLIDLLTKTKKHSFLSELIE